MESAWQMAMSSVLALSIGGFAAVLGLWVGRDKTRPLSFAVAMTVLIVSAVAVGVVQSVLDAEESIQKQADLDRMVETVSEIAMASGDEELAKLIEEQTGKAIEMPEPEPEPELDAGDTGTAEEAAAEDAAAEEGAAEDAAAEDAAAADANPTTDGADAPAAE